MNLENQEIFDRMILSTNNSMQMKFQQLTCPENAKFAQSIHFPHAWNYMDLNFPWPPNLEDLKKAHKLCNPNIFDMYLVVGQLQAMLNIKEEKTVEDWSAGSRFGGLKKYKNIIAYKFQDDPSKHLHFIVCIQFLMGCIIEELYHKTPSNEDIEKMARMKANEVCGLIREELITACVRRFDGIY